MIDETVPYSWFQREGFTHSRKLLLIFWLVMGDFILLGYKGTLLSNLVQTRYENSIESYDDVEKAGLKFLVPKFRGSEEWIEAHPHLSRMEMAGNLIRYPLEQAGSEWWTQM